MAYSFFFFFFLIELSYILDDISLMGKKKKNNQKNKPSGSCFAMLSKVGPYPVVMPTKYWAAE